MVAAEEDEQSADGGRHEEEAAVRKDVLPEAAGAVLACGAGRSERQSQQGRAPPMGTHV